MDPLTGELYPSLEAARAAGVDDPVELVGSPAAVASVSAAVGRDHDRRRARGRAKAKRAKAARKRNR